MIHAIFCNPPIAVARLGGSPRPLDAYGWEAAANPRTAGETVIVPRWTLEVLPDGSVQPILPQEIAFKDGDEIRPVCPFIELWAWTGPAGAGEADRIAEPITPVLLAAEGLTLAAITIEVNARNLKAARRRDDPQLAFGTFPPVRFAANDHTAKPLSGISPPGANPPMIPAGRSIPMGSVRMIRPRAQPQPSSGVEWTDEVDISVLRLRITPPAGLCYGPDIPDAQLVEAGFPNVARNRAVPRSRAFLDRNAGWHEGSPDERDRLFPADTIDATPADASLGVIDDTSEILVTVELAVPGREVAFARATVMVSPPDFAPDRRPFFSLADEINDLSSGADERSDAMDAVALERWVGDLFERVFETLDLLNLDRLRGAIVGGRPSGFAAGPLPESRLAAPIPNDTSPDPAFAMGGRDALRNRDFALSAPPDPDDPADPIRLPLIRHARERHRALADVQALRNFVAANPNRLRALVRGPFETETVPPRRAGLAPREGLRNTTMRMPPFMAQSTPNTPLTLTAWQYTLLMRWLDFALSGGAVGPLQPEGVLSEDAEAARAEVLAAPESADLDW